MVGMTGSILIAVDGGGSKTDVVALDSRGEIRARVRAGGSSPHLEGLDRSVETIVDAIRDVCSQAAVPVVRSVHVYLSGLDLPIEIDEFREAFSAAAPDLTTALVVKNDLFAVLRAGTQATDAVAVICGSGTNCIGMRHDGAEVTYASLGMISGDWGGGFSLGEWGLWFAARSEDGRGEPTQLQREIPRHFGLETISAVTESLHRRRIERGRLIELVPVLFALAEGGDAISRRIVTWQAEEIAVTAATTIERLGLTDVDVPVVVGGGVVSSGNPLLLSLLENELSRRAPLATLTIVSEAPVVGAALLALDAIDADAEAHSVFEETWHAQVPAAV